jgi:HSP20 family molecular chaperone IbpA
MADLATRGNAGIAGNPGLATLLGFDPFRDFLPTWQQAAGIDVQRTESGFTVELPVPGFKPEEINVTIEDRTLTVAGESERRKFTRALLLPDEIDTEKIDAHVQHGLLTLTLNVHPKARPKKIQVKYSN